LKLSLLRAIYYCSPSDYCGWFNWNPFHHD
jgi:hypothetical protein